MTNPVDFQKSFDALQSLMNLQAAAITKSIEQQKKSGEQLTSFFKTEAERAKDLKTPEELIKFNMEANKSLFELLKGQGEAFTSIANETREAALTEIQAIAK